MKLLEERALDGETAVRYGVSVSRKDGTEIVKFPYVRNGEIVNNKYRSFPEKKFWQDGGVKLPWNEDCLRDDTLKGQPLLITEGEFDALAAIQCGYPRTVSVPDGAPSKSIEGDSSKYDWLEYFMSLIRDCNEIIICADGDPVGANLLHDLSLRLGRARCKWVKYPKGCKDLNDALMKYGHRGVVETINRAEWIRVDGVYKLSELPPPPSFKPVSAGMGFDDNFKPRLGDFVIVTGIPSHGKSAWVNDLTCHLAEKHGWKTAHASFEQHPQLDHRRNLLRWKNGRFLDKQSPQEIFQGEQWIDENFVFIVPSEDDDVSLDWFLDKASVAVVRHGCKVVVVDPWNELDHVRPKDMSLTEYTGFAIKQFKKFAKKHGVLLIVVAHPAKLLPNKDGEMPVPTLYTISDSAHWYNKADVGIVIHRKPECTKLIIAKVRYHDIIGKPAELDMQYNYEQNRFRII